MLTVTERRDLLQKAYKFVLDFNDSWHKLADINTNPDGLEDILSYIKLRENPRQAKCKFKSMPEITLICTNTMTKITLDSFYDEYLMIDQAMSFLDYFWWPHNSRSLVTD